MRATSGWRTTSALVKRQMAMPLHALEHALGVDQAAELGLGQVDLAHVAGDHGACEPKPMRVRNIFICSGVVFCASSRITKALFSVRPRMKASGAISSALRSKAFCTLLETHQVVERVVQRAQVGVDLLRQVAGQKAQALAGFHRRAREHDALHHAALQRIHRAWPRPGRSCRCRPGRCRR